MGVALGKSGDLLFEGVAVPRDSQLNILGTIVTQTLSPENHINARIAAAWRAFWAERGLLLARGTDIMQRLKLLKAFIMPILVFGVETQQVGPNDLKRLDSAFIDMASRVIAMPRAGRPWLEWRIDSLRSARAALEEAHFNRVATVVGRAMFRVACWAVSGEGRVGVD